MRKMCYAVLVTILAAGILSACGTNAATGPVTPTEPPVQTETPTPEPTATPTEAPSPTGEPLTPTVTPTPTPEPVKELSEFDPKDFFADAVFCGDSLMHLYRFRGGPSTTPDIFGDRNTSSWLTITNYCARLAVKDVSAMLPWEKASVPSFRGEKVNLWDAIPQTGKKRVMLFFGLNDIGPVGIDQFIADYKAVIEHIRETTPDAKFYILSVTPVRKDLRDGWLNSKSIQKTNERLVEMCEENGWTYVDVTTILSDSEGYLITVKDGKSLSDGSNVHLTNAGYVYWDIVLEQLAREELRKEYYEGRK